MVQQSDQTPIRIHEQSDLAELLVILQSFQTCIVSTESLGPDRYGQWTLLWTVLVENRAKLEALREQLANLGLIGRG